MTEQRIFNWRSVLAENVWKEGKVIPIVDGSYRQRTVVTCYSMGRQKTKFANGEHNFAAYVELIRPDGTWISQGMGIVPVLPDGRLIMVVEQRPPQFRLPNQPTSIRCGDKTIDLRQFGPYSSVEFPGGAVDPEHRLTSGFLKELEEETEVEEQTATLYLRVPPWFAEGADLALEGNLGVVFLSRSTFSSFVKSDGGLHVLALSAEDVQHNIWAGNIRSGQAMLMGWSFYREVDEAIRRSKTLEVSVGECPNPIEKMQAAGYLEIKKVHIKRS